tara:strand:- start:1737 stop:1961 length:225 start_codon:yes stop_codon:yes gene_type:complete
MYRYQPGNILREYATVMGGKNLKLTGVFFIISMDEDEVTVVSMYDRDGFWLPMQKTQFNHKDLKNRKNWIWEVK